MEQQELSFIACRNFKNDTAILEDSLAVSYKTEHTPTIWLRNHSSVFTQWVENVYPHKKLHIDAYGSFVPNCQNSEVTKMSPVGEWINKLWYFQTMEY
jgi:hypothetical protein